MKRLQDRVAIITGAAAGLGRAIALAYVAEGAKVVAADIHQKNLELLQTEVKASGGDITTVLADVSKPEDIDNMFSVASRAYGTVDILVNNAGILDDYNPAGDMPDELWQHVMDVNLTAPFRATRGALKIMLAKGRGVILNISSVGGLNGFRAGAAYTATKHGLIGLTKNTAYAYLARGIRCNAIAPGGMKTPLADTFSAETMNRFGIERFLDAMGSAKGIESTDPKNVANVAVFLASDEACYVNGSVVTVDGGWTAF